MKKLFIICIATFLLFGCVSNDSTGEAIKSNQGSPSILQENELIANSQENLITIDGKYYFTEIENFGPENFTTEHAEYINSQGTLTRINFQQKPSGLKYGDFIRVEGLISKNTSLSENILETAKVEILPTGDNVIAGVEENPSLGGQKTAIILVNDVLDPNYHPYTKEEIWNEILNPDNPVSTNSYYREISYGKAWLSGDIGDIYGYYPAQTQYISRNLNAAMDVIDPDIDFIEKNYRRIIFIFFKSDSDSLNGNSYFIGLFPLETDEGIINMGVTMNSVGNNSLSSVQATRLIRHELGHNFGARHSGSYDCGTNVVGDNCYFFEMGDIYDVMGGRNPYHFSEITTGKFHINSIHKEMMGWADTTINIGWFNSGNVLEISNELNNFGEYTLKPLELPTNGIQVIKTPSFPYQYIGEAETAEAKYYYLEFRDKIGFDSDIEQPFVLLHLRAFDLPFDEPFWEYIEGSGNSLQLIGNNGSAKELTEGEEFIDELSNLKIRINEIGEHYANVNISSFIPVCGNKILETNEQCDDGNLNNFDGCSSTCTIDPSYKIFATSQKFNGNLSGLSGADLKCAVAARAGGFSPNAKWKAWMSSSTTNAKDRLYNSLLFGFRKTDGTMVANNWADLTDGSLDSPINLTEASVLLTSIDSVWTGTIANGTKATNNCSNWTSTDLKKFGTAGLVSSTVIGWTERGTPKCSTTAHIYCIEQPWCGNGIQETYTNERGGTIKEWCDDGNLINGDGCTAKCTKETISIIEPIPVEPIPIKLP